MATTSTTSTSLTGRQTPRRSGTMSTAEIKSRIEAMFADDRRPTHRAVTR
jgi:hypothetical protein